MDRSYYSYCYINIGRDEIFYDKANLMIETIFIRKILNYSGVLRLKNYLLAYFK